MNPVNFLRLITHLSNCIIIHICILIRNFNYNFIIVYNQQLYNYLHIQIYIIKYRYFLLFFFIKRIHRAIISMPISLWLFDPRYPVIWRAYEGKSLSIPYLGSEPILTRASGQLLELESTVVI